VDNALLLLLFGAIGLFIFVLVALIIYALGHAVGFITRLALSTRVQNAASIAKRVKILMIVGVVSFLAYGIYFAIFPDDDFFLAEAAHATKHSPPEDAVVIAKHATYPDFHGDYCSFSRLRMSQASFETYLAKLSNEASLTYTPSTQTSTGSPSGLDLPPMVAMSHFRRNDVKSDHHYSVLFMADRTHVEVQICVT